MPGSPFFCANRSPLPRANFLQTREALPGAEIDATQLALLLNGVDLRSAKRRKRYSRVA